jgi:hypothetical protein
MCWLGFLGAAGWYVAAMGTTGKTQKWLCWFNGATALFLGIIGV